MSSSAITRPLIGLTSYVERVRWGPWDKPAVLVPLTYVGAVERAGGEPVLLPSTGSARPKFVRSLDGLVVIGGNDINPETYGAERHPETTRVRERRDRSELEVLRDALDAKVPVLGICRGMQLLNIVRGGDLVQHLADSRPGDLHKRAPGVYTTHDVRTAPGSRLAGVLGPTTTVASHHHQAPKELGDGLRATAWAPDDTVEGIEDTSGLFAVAVLWHPEERDDTDLMRCLVEEAAIRRQHKREMR